MEVSRTQETIVETKAVVAHMVVLTLSSISQQSFQRLQTTNRVFTESVCSNHPSLNRNTIISVGDKVIIIYRFAGQYFTIGTVFETTTAYVKLRIPVRSVYKKQHDKVALYLP